jgi:hypothetical protein
MSTLTPSSWLSRLRQTKTQHGACAALQLVIDRLGRKLLKSLVTKTVHLEAKNIVDRLEPDPEFTFRFLSADEVRAFASDPRNELGTAFISRAEAGHDLCFAALYGDRLAAYGWYALGSIEAQHGGGLAMSFPANMAYMYKCFTHPDFRGKRLNGLVMGLALQELASRGVEQLIAMIEWTNWASLKSCYRLGFTNLGRNIRIGAACCTFTIASRAPCRLGVRIGKKADLSGRM